MGRDVSRWSGTFLNHTPYTGSEPATGSSRHQLLYLPAFPSTPLNVVLAPTAPHPPPRLAFLPGSMQVGLVSQEPTLFQTSIYENIAMGHPDGHASQEQVEEAARRANAHKFIAAMPRGYQTQVCRVPGMLVWAPWDAGFRPIRMLA